MLSNHNIILDSDSYKYSMPDQYPPGTQSVYSYIESRGGEWDRTVFMGLQPIMIKLAKGVTKDDVDEAEKLITMHGEPFYRAGWDYIVNELGGKLPVIIKSVPEGTIIPTRNVLVTIENTDPKCWWLTTFLETAILRSVWYMTTVATNSFESKKIIMSYLEKNGDPAGIAFKLNDFGSRGVSSYESSALGGIAHLAIFMGSDNVPAIREARRIYRSQCAGFSIPAMEHSTVTSWTRAGEVAAYRNMLKLYGKPGAMLAVVSDSYNIYEACKMWGKELKDEVIASGATVVIRPDSGLPSEVVLNCVRILDKYYGSTINAKGFKVLNNVRVIQGDGIDHASIRSILFCLDMNQYSADNVAFGQGGALLQQVNRDTMKFAMKCSSITIANDGTGKLEYRDVYKNPITDQGKVSKKGRVTLFRNQDGTYYSGVEDWMEPVLKTVFNNGSMVGFTTLDEVRANVLATE